MFAPGLPPALRRVMHLAQSFSRCRVARDIWKSGQCRAFSRKPEEPVSDDTKKPRPRTDSRIMLMSPDNTSTVTVLKVAQRLAKQRNLTLVKVNDLEGNIHRPVYKLVNSTGILEGTKEIEVVTKNADKTTQKLGTKLFYISAKITEHDLQTKTRNLVRLLSKGHKVKVAITMATNNEDKMIQRVIEDAVRNDGSVQQMSSKKNVILLLITPLSKNEDVSVDNKDGIGSSSN